jgi:hypothetical protein
MTTGGMLDDFYGLLDELAARVGGPRRLAECSKTTGWPQRGVYFFFEPGEVRRDGRPRVVRVGTHALTASSGSTLWSRLRQHRGSTGGRNPGGGNHRGSIFRLHVGTALLRSAPDLASHPAQATWGRGAHATAEVRAGERDLERRVTDYIGAMPLLWLNVDDPPGPASDRGLIEASAIALLSSAANPAADPPSTTWLGHHAERAAVRTSGLWNVNHISDPVDPNLLDRLDHWQQRTTPT